MPPIGRRVGPEIEHDVVQRALEAGHELGLGAGTDLVVQAAQRAAPLGEGQVRLLDPRTHAERGQLLAAEAAGEEAALVDPWLGLQDQHAR